ncbi:hypothetical protein HK099_001673 [Clydaea vesicula]|uniref:Glycosyltransferase 61 catalytic domain-containing protein n=1 Tax=Clydaea vesicula TaxID=447962 RepID=A0AAD5UBJ2_9FUNG|nr:hypothetical protein HK099_001673 [Clydaea vesicula]KAJ3394635.1 hypothetical protein HDU92_006740 [Lobulomyces angularis]
MISSVVNVESEYIKNCNSYKKNLELSTFFISNFNTPISLSNLTETREISTLKEIFEFKDKFCFVKDINLKKKIDIDSLEKVEYVNKLYWFGKKTCELLTLTKHSKHELKKCRMQKKLRKLNDFSKGVINPLPIQIHDQFLIGVSNSLILDTGIVLVNQNLIISLLGQCTRTFEQKAVYDSQILLSDLTMYPKVFVLSQTYVNEVYHGMIEVIPRIAFYLKELKSRGDIFLHVGKSYSVSHKFLIFLGFDSSRLIFGKVFSREVYLPEPSYHCGVVVRQLIHDRLTNHFYPSDVKMENLKRYVLVIKRDTSRTIYKFNTFVSTLRSKFPDQSFLIFDSKFLPSMEKAFQLFAGAKLVIGIHGAGLSNLIAAQQNTSVIEIFPQDYPNFCYLDLATKLELNYNGILIKNSTFGGKFYFSKREVNEILETMSRNQHEQHAPSSFQSNYLMLGSQQAVIHNQHQIYQNQPQFHQQLQQTPFQLQQQQSYQSQQQVPSQLQQVLSPFNQNQPYTLNQNAYNGSGRRPSFPPNVQYTHRTPPNVGFNANPSSPPRTMIRQNSADIPQRQVFVFPPQAIPPPPSQQPPVLHRNNTQRLNNPNEYSTMMIPKKISNNKGGGISSQMLRQRRPSQINIFVDMDEDFIDCVEDFLCMFDSKTLEAQPFLREFTKILIARWQKRYLRNYSAADSFAASSTGARGYLATNGINMNENSSKIFSQLAYCLASLKVESNKLIWMKNNKINLENNPNLNVPGNSLEARLNSIELLKSDYIKRAISWTPELARRAKKRQSKCLSIFMENHNIIDYKNTVKPQINFNLYKSPITNYQNFQLQQQRPRKISQQQTKNLTRIKIQPPAPVNQPMSPRIQSPKLNSNRNISFNNVRSRNSNIHRVNLEPNIFRSDDLDDEDDRKYQDSKSLTRNNSILSESGLIPSGSGNGRRGSADKLQNLIDELGETISIMGE